MESQEWISAWFTLQGVGNERSALVLGAHNTAVEAEVTVQSLHPVEHHRLVRVSFLSGKG